MKRTVLALVLALSFSLASAQEVSFGYVEWPGVTVKTHVASEILSTLGYDTEMSSLSVPLVLRGVANGDLDAFLGVWVPSMNGIIDPYLSEGSVTQVAVNLNETVYRPAVPTYVYEAGVTSLADLTAYSEQFEQDFYAIEPGNDGNQIMLDAVANGTYGLGDWDIVESSTEAMLAAVGRATDRDEWIVFLAWSPHWMNAVYDIRYLDDPEGIWGSDGYVATVMNTESAEAMPNVSLFLSQLQVTSDIQNLWIDRYSRQGQDPAEVASTWISENLDIVLQWADGVTTASGEPASDVLSARFATSE